MRDRDSTIYVACSNTNVNIAARALAASVCTRHDGVQMYVSIALPLKQSARKASTHDRIS